jgi:hypothetical protein
MRPWLELIRLPAVFTAPADVLAGLALGGFAVSGPGDVGRAALLVLASVAIYAAGMAANDLFDLEVDRLERPGRPLPSGRIRPAAAWRFVAGLQCLGCGLAVAGGGPLAGAAAAGTVLLTYLYNGVLKHSALGPLAMGACRFGNAAIGLAAMGVTAPTTWAMPLGTLVYVAAVTWVSRHEARGEVTPSLHAALVALPLVALFPAGLAGLGALPEPAGIVAACAAPLWLLPPVRRAWNGGPGPVRGAVMAGIFGIPLVDAALCVAAGRPGLAGVIVGFALVGRATGRRFYAT